MIDPAAPLPAPPPGAPADLVLGAFTPHPPWIVDPDAMPWRSGVAGEPDVDTLRRQAADLARVLVHPQHLPSLGRVLTVAWRLGIPLLTWGAKERGTPESPVMVNRSYGKEPRLRSVALAHGDGAAERDDGGRTEPHEQVVESSQRERSCSRSGTRSP